MDPTEGEIQTQIANTVHLLEEAREFAEVTASKNWLTLEGTLVAALESDYAAEWLAAVASGRSRLDALLREASRMIEPGLRTYAKLMNVPEVDPQGILTRLYDRFVDNTLRVTSRQFTFGSPAAGGSNAGSGTILRLTKDERNFDLEAQHPDAKTAECVQDQSTGTEKHEEVFEVRGQAAGRDALQVSGSGRRANLAALSARSSLLLNPSFSQFAGTAAAPTSLTSWTSSVTVNSTNYSLDGTNYYRDFPGDSTPYALNVKVTANLSQARSVRRTNLSAGVPYLLQVAWNRQVGSASGTLVARMGGASTSVAVSAQTGWQVLRVPTSPGQNCWYRNFDEQDLDLRLEWTRTGGELLLDDVLFVPATAFDGAWYWVLGGATPFLREDEFTWTDTAVEAVLQRWFWRSFGRYLPHGTGSAVTWADP